MKSVVRDCPGEYLLCKLLTTVFGSAVLQPPWEGVFVTKHDHAVKKKKHPVNLKLLAKNIDCPFKSSFLLLLLFVWFFFFSLDLLELILYLLFPPVLVVSFRKLLLFWVKTDDPVGLAAFSNDTWQALNLCMPPAELFWKKSGLFWCLGHLIMHGLFLECRESLGNLDTSFLWNLPQNRVDPRCYKLGVRNDL